jgi:glycosyltransferase involved in cell wall biosynthesis
VAVRVLWLTKGLGPGGAERLLVEMARTLDRRRVDVTAAYVLPWKDHLAGELEVAGVRTVCLSKTRRDPRWPWRLRRLLADGEVDVVHAHSPVPAVAARLAALTLPRHRRPTVITTEHNTWTSHHPVTRWANRLTGRRDAATFAVTDEARSTIRGAAAGRALVLVHGIDVAGTAARPPGERQRIRAELGLSDDEVVIGTVANFRAQKDYPNLLAAAARLVERQVPFRLVAVGQGQLEAEILKQRDELGLADHVILAGFRPDAVGVMGACDIFVLASAWEGLPVAVMEALALGLPIVATNVGGVAESPRRSTRPTPSSCRRETPRRWRTRS